MNRELVGECLTFGTEGAIYDAFMEIDGQYFQRPAYLKHFDPAVYREEIRSILEGK